MKKIQQYLKKLPEWIVFMYLFLSLSVGPLLVFDSKWKQLGSLREAAVVAVADTWLPEVRLVDQLAADSVAESEQLNLSC